MNEADAENVVAVLLSRAVDDGVVKVSFFVVEDDDLLPVAFFPIDVVNTEKFEVMSTTVVADSEIEVAFVVVVVVVALVVVVTFVVVEAFETFAAALVDWVLATVNGVELFVIISVVMLDFKISVIRDGVAVVADTDAVWLLLGTVIDVEFIAMVVILESVI